MSEHTLPSPEITYVHEPAEGTKKIWKVFWILSVITVIELGLGMTLYFMSSLPEDLRQHLIKGLIIILSLAKAYFIVSVFMHLGDEIRNFIMTVVVPLCLFIWFITAFLWDGNSWKNLRNRYDKKTDTEQVIPAAEKGAKG